MPYRLVLTAAASVAVSVSAALLGAVGPASASASVSVPVPASVSASAPASGPAPASVPSGASGGAAATGEPGLSWLATAAAPPAPLSARAPSDQFTVTVARTGTATADGTFKLKCGPVGGTHPHARAACDRLAELARTGRDPFAPVAPGAMCTMEHGGDAAARITGTWRGSRVDASFSRKNGCEIARWRTLEPVLPSAKR